MTSSRAQEIANAKGAAPAKITRRDLAYVREFYELFGCEEFSHTQIRRRMLRESIGQRTSIISNKLDDRTVLGKRLPNLGLLVHTQLGAYQLTNALAKKKAELEPKRTA